jgi:hypothetical protein
MTQPLRSPGLAGVATALLLACGAGAPPGEPTAQPLAQPTPSAPLEPAIRQALEGDFEAHYFEASVDLVGSGNSCRSIPETLAG